MLLRLYKVMSIIIDLPLFTLSNMPKIILKYRFAFGLMLLMGLMSCEKTWSCRCMMVTGQETIMIIEKATKKEAEEVCQKRIETKYLDERLSRCTFEGKYKGNKI